MGGRLCRRWQKGDVMVTRRRFVQLSAAAGVAAMTSQKSRAEVRERVRDRMWLWSHHPGVYDGMFGLPRNSRITPVDAARYLGTPNIMFIRASGQPAYPFEAYAAAFKDVKRLQWSITGSAGATSVSYTHLRAHETVLDLVCRLLLEKKKYHTPTLPKQHHCPTLLLHTHITLSTITIK